MCNFDTQGNSYYMLDNVNREIYHLGETMPAK